MTRGDDMGVEFAVLGPVEVSADGRPLEGAAPRHRAVLAHLLLHSRTVLGADRLIEAMWGPTPPGTARAQIHATMTAIRRVLRTADAADLLQTRPAGYVILPQPGQFDLEVFTGRIASAKVLAATDPEAAVRRIRTALDLWRGTPLADVNAYYVADARARLEERRLAAFELLGELDLSLGRHEEILDELTARTVAHPLRERFCAQLVLALHRAHRQADALTAARSFRSALVEQQGLDPSRTFVALEEAVLRDDPSLALPPTAPPAPYVPSATVAPGSTSSTSSADRRVVRPGRTAGQAGFLPYDLPDFSGRAEELDRLLRVRPGRATAVRVSTVDGMAGIGKTALAVHAGHRLRDRFPDGQLYVDLRAHADGQAPVAAGEALGLLLRQLGVPPERIPATDAERGALWRAELSGRRVLAVLDDAADTDHVRPLLPGASDSHMLITSRRRLTDLDGAHALSLDVLPAAEAIELFSRIVGERADAEPLAVLDVLHMCGFLPLAVRIAAARLHHRPQWTVAYLADRLRERRHRLTELSTSDRGVGTAFALSYQQLAPDQRRMFRLLGLHPGHDIEVHAAAALAGVPLEKAEILLEDLLDAHVLLQHEPGRYIFQRLLREHARATATAEETGDARHIALTRLFDHYLSTAPAAVDLLFPGREERRQGHPAPSRPPMPLTDRGQATAWLDSERANLIAVGTYTGSHSWPAHTVGLAAALHRYLYDHAHHADALILHAQALQASRQLADTAAEGRTLTDLSRLYWRQGHYEQAADHARQALTLGRDTGDRRGEARARHSLGFVLVRQRRNEEAREHFRRALDLFRTTGDQLGEATALTGLGVVHERQGRYTRAGDHHQQALRIHRSLANQGGEAVALAHLGTVLHRQGRYAQAHSLHQEAARLHHGLGDRGHEAEVLNGLGDIARSRQDPAGAVTHYCAALSLACEISLRPEQARAHAGLARARHDLGDVGQAHEHARQALTLCLGLGLPDAEEARAYLSALEAPRGRSA
ncbi:tetratricopeptide repeat protein [Streptomyces sp. NPDC060322]|uniref:AfsR/SARP family transcriptional regulator n=1 Tax=Streptomyces sp. NPDC060322 TaxID=3347097 RepID=UPI00365EAC50